MNRWATSALAAFGQFSTWKTLPLRGSMTTHQASFLCQFVPGLSFDGVDWYAAPT